MAGSVWSPQNPFDAPVVALPTDVFCRSPRLRLYQRWSNRVNQGQRRTRDCISTSEDYCESLLTIKRRKRYGDCMALSMTYVRPDRVIKTGVIAPYPIRQYSPVALARNVIRPFINGIRPNGPVYQNPQPQTMAGAMAGSMAYGVRHMSPGAGRQIRPVQMFGSPAPSMPSSFLNRVLAKARGVTQGLPGMVRMGNRPVVMRNQRPHVATAGPRVVHSAAQGLPQQGPAQAAYRWEQAASRGTMWDMTFARQREMQLFRR